MHCVEGYIRFVALHVLLILGMNGLILSQIGSKYMSAIAIKEMDNHEEMWQKYYNDFIYHYLYLSANPDDLEHKLLEITFCDIFSNYKEMKAIVVHCYLHLYQLDLAKIVVLLKSLRKLKVFNKDSRKSLYQGNPQSSFFAKLQTSKCFTNSSVSKFVIESLFVVLVDTIYSKDSSNRLSVLQKWFNSYKDTVSLHNIANKLCS